MKQAGRIAQQNLNRLLEEKGYVETEQHCIWKLADPASPMVFINHVDDFEVAYTNRNDAERLFAVMEEAGYIIKRDWEAKKFCGYDVLHDRQQATITLSMPNAVPNMLERFNMHTVKRRSTPYPTSRPDPTKSQDPIPLDVSAMLTPPQVRLLQEKIGTMGYLAEAVRPDIITHVGKLRTRQAKMTVSLMQDADWMIGYLAANPNRGITFRASELHLKGYTDASFAAEPGSRSRTGTVFYFGNRHEPDFVNGPIECTSNVQQIVTASVAEAEYVAMFEGGKRNAHIRHLTEVFGLRQEPTRIGVDNTCAIGLANDTMVNRSNRHIERRFHWVRDQVRLGNIKVEYQPGKANPADFFTKYMLPAEHTMYKDMFTTQMESSPASPARAQNHDTEGQRRGCVGNAPRTGQSPVRNAGNRQRLSSAQHCI